MIPRSRQRLEFHHDSSIGVNLVSPEARGYAWDIEAGIQVILALLYIERDFQSTLHVYAQELNNEAHQLVQQEDGSVRLQEIFEHLLGLIQYFLDEDTTSLLRKGRSAKTAADWGELCNKALEIITMPSFSEVARPRPMGRRLQLSYSLILKDLNQKNDAEQQEVLRRFRNKVQAISEVMKRLPPREKFEDREPFEPRDSYTPSR